MSKCLFITWDGPQVSYLEGLFLPIFEGLAEHGHQFHVLQFTWGSSERVASTEALCRAANIPYRSVTINRRLGPIGPLLSAVLGARHIRTAVRDWGIDTLMPRSLMPALATLSMRDRKGLRIIFDADGFAVDERVDFAGLSPGSFNYRIMRDIESQMVRVADSVLTRTNSAIPILQARAGAGTDPSKYFVVSNGREVVPLCYGDDTVDEIGPVVGYIGSIGQQYCPEIMLDVAMALRSRYPDLKFQIFSADGDNMKKTLCNKGLTNTEWISIERIAPQDVTKRLARCDVGLSFRQPMFSTQGIAPIKLGDYLLAGVPIVGFPGVGNTQPLVDAGVFFPSDGSNLDDIVEWFSRTVKGDRHGVRTKCRRLGEEHFSVKGSVERYLLAL
jgi:hypothetical protein